MKKNRFVLLVDIYDPKRNIGSLPSFIDINKKKLVANFLKFVDSKKTKQEYKDYSFVKKKQVDYDYPDFRGDIFKIFFGLFPLKLAVYTDRFSFKVAIPTKKDEFKVYTVDYSFKENNNDLKSCFLDFLNTLM